MEIQEEETPTNRMPKVLGKPVPPSQGGHGEILQSKFASAVDEVFEVDGVEIRRLVRAVAEPVAIEVRTMFGEFDDSYADAQEISIWDNWHDTVLWGEVLDAVPELTSLGITNARSFASKTFNKSSWWLRKVDDLVDEDVLSILSDFIESKTIEQAKFDYEIGKSDTLINAVQLGDKGTAKFMREVRHSIKGLWSTVGNRIINATITGTRQTMCNKGNFAVLDTATFLDDNMDEVVYNVVSELRHVARGLLSDYADEITKLINITLEDV